MASWRDRAVETSFKPTEGGYVFQCPNPWLFGRMRSFLVTEAQKEQLAVFLRQRQRVILWLMAIYILIAFGLTEMLQSMTPIPDPSTPGFFAITALVMLGMFGLAMAPHLYLMRKIKPVLAQAQTSEQAITLSEQIFGVAAVISNLHVGLGALGGLLIVISNVKTIVEELAAGRVGSQLVFSGLGLLAGGALLAYFSYLAILKMKLKSKPK